MRTIQDNRKIRSLLLAFILGVAFLMITMDMVAAQKMIQDPTTGMMVSKPEYGGTITFAIKEEPPNTDTWYGYPSAPAVWYSNEKLGTLDWALDRNKYDFRSTFIPDLAIVGHLAESWEQPDPMTYVIRIRQGIHWHDKSPMNGRELTSEDIKFNWHRYLGLGSGYEKASSHIVQQSTLGDVGIESVTATDRYTVVFKTRRPTPEGLRKIFLDNSSFILPPEVIKQHGDIQDWQKLVGTGPFELMDWVKGSSMSWTKNPDYWGLDEKYPGNRLPYVDHVKVLVLQDEATRLAAFRLGMVDLLGKTPDTRIKSIEIIENLKKNYPGMQIEPTFSSEEFVFPFDINIAPFSDIRVRHAVQMALDLETINQIYYKGWANVTPEGYYTITGNYFEKWPEEVREFYTYNPNAAKELLDEAGYPPGADGIRFSTELQVTQTDDLDFYNIAAIYLKNVGIETRITQLDPMYWATHSQGGRTYNKLVDKIKAAPTSEKQNELLNAAVEKHEVFWKGNTPNDFTVNQEWIKSFNGEQIGGNVGGVITARLWNDQDKKAEEIPKLTNLPNPSSSYAINSTILKQNGADPTFEEVNQTLIKVLDGTIDPYHERRYYIYKQGFALITRLERFNCKDGTTMTGNERWEVGSQQDHHNFQKKFKFFENARNWVEKAIPIFRRRLPKHPIIVALATIFFDYKESRELLASGVELLASGLELLASYFSGAPDGCYRMFVFTVSHGHSYEGEITYPQVDQLFQEGWSNFPNNLRDKIFTEDFFCNVLVYEFKQNDGTPEFVTLGKGGISAKTHLEQAGMGKLTETRR